MNLVKGKESLVPTIYSDRLIYKAVGKDGPVSSQKMSIGFGHYSYEIGAMDPHQHAEETVFIIEASNASFRYGASKEQLGEQIPLERGMLLHFDEMEWHVFDCSEGGELDIIFIYGQVDNIRPEDINR